MLFHTPISFIRACDYTCKENSYLYPCVIRIQIWSWDFVRQCEHGLTSRSEQQWTDQSAALLGTRRQALSSDWQGEAGLSSVSDWLDWGGFVPGEWPGVSSGQNADRLAGRWRCSEAHCVITPQHGITVQNVKRYSLCFVVKLQFIIEFCELVNT